MRLVSDRFAPLFQYWVQRVHLGYKDKWRWSKLRLDDKATPALCVAGRRSDLEQCVTSQTWIAPTDSTVATSDGRVKRTLPKFHVIASRRGSPRPARQTSRPGEARVPLCVDALPTRYGRRGLGSDTVSLHTSTSRASRSTHPDPTLSKSGQSNSSTSLHQSHRYAAPRPTMSRRTSVSFSSAPG